MKSWFGVLGRSCLEFFLILAVSALVAGASSSLGASLATGRALLGFALASLPRLIPLAAAATLFCAMFSFEHRLASRAAAWLGLVLLGAALLAGGLASRRLPLLWELLPEEPRLAAAPPLQAPGFGEERAGVLLWFRSAQDGEARDAVIVDFRAPFPRLSYAAEAALDRASGMIELGGARYAAASARTAPEPLFPEARLLAGPPIWERFDGLAELPLGMAAAVLGGFVLLASGFRFIARLTRWPLANAFFAVAGFLAFLALDAALASPAIASLGSSLARRAGLPQAVYLAGAAAEGFLGLALGALDLAFKPRRSLAHG